MVSFVLLMEPLNKKADPKSVSMVHGGLSVIAGGITLMHISFAKHLDMMVQVRILLCKCTNVCHTHNNTPCMQILLYMNVVTLDEDWTFQCGVKWNVWDGKTM